jgi:putative transposase
VQAIGRQPQRAPDGAALHYERHRPEQTTLYRLVQQHAASFIAVSAAIGTVFVQDSADTARTQWRSVADQLRGKFPKLGALMDEAENDVLAFMTFPRAHWTQIYSTNPLERLNAEIKRRTRVVGIFPNDASITRLVGAMMLEQNDEWSLNRRYMQLEGLQTLSDTVPTRLSAVAR